MDIILDDDRI